MEIKRNRYLNTLISKKHNGLIKVITGMRRCGKSYLLFTLFKEHLLSEGVAEDHIIEIAFDAFENKKYRDPDVLYPYLKEQIKDDAMYYVLLHEVTLCRQPPLNHPSNDKPCPLPYNDYRIKRGDECCFSLCLQGKSLNYRRKKS